MPNQEKQEKIEKRGRKAIKMTIALSHFFNKNGQGPPRKEYLRCGLFRKMFKMIKSININKARIIIHPAYAQFCIIVKNNSEIIKTKIDRTQLPYVENKANSSFKSYNNAFCRGFLQDELMKSIFFLFVDVLFSTFTIKELQKTIGVFCCRQECTDQEACRMKYDQLKQIILEDFLLEKTFS
jgi:hypothetical protein